LKRIKQQSQNPSAMKKILFLFSFFLPCLMVQGQSQLQQVIATSGGSGQSGELAVEWTLGEPVIATLSNETTILSQGFHQPGLVITAIKMPVEIPYTLEAYPNPACDRLLIKLENEETADYQYGLYDMNGRLLEEKELQGDVTTVDMNHYPFGIYLLRISLSGKEVKTFEVIKQ